MACQPKLRATQRRSAAQSLNTWRGSLDTESGYAMEALRGQLLAGLLAGQQGDCEPAAAADAPPPPELQVSSWQPSVALQRWHHAVALVTESRRMQHDIDKLQSRHSTAAGEPNHQGGAAPQ